jgi:hypothetical protein
MGELDDNERTRTRLHRRGFLLASASSCVAGLTAATGCIGGTQGADSSDPTGVVEREGAAGVTVSLRQPANVVKTRNKLSDELGSSVPLEETNGSVRPYLRDAVEGDGTRAIEADEIDDELLRAVRDLDHVRYAGGVYEVEHRLPVHVVSGSVVEDEGSVDEDRTVQMSDDVIRVVGEENRQVAHMAMEVIETDGRRRFVGTGEYTTPSIGDGLEGFLNRTDYIGVPTGDDPTRSDKYVELEVSHEDPGEPYEIRARRLDDKNLFGVEVTPVEELDDSLERIVRFAAGHPEGYRAETLPDGHEDVFAPPDAGEEEVTYYLVDDEAHAAYLRQPNYGDIPVELGIGVSVGESKKGDAGEVVKLDLTVTNTSGRKVEIESGAPGPFGVLGAERVENPDAEREFGEGEALWSVAYGESEDVSVTERGIMVNSIAVITELEPGDSETTIYEVGEEFESGTYEVRESVAVVRNGLMGSTRWSYPYTLVIDVGEG